MVRHTLIMWPSLTVLRTATHGSHSVVSILVFLLSLLLCNAAALVSGDDYMTFNQNFAIINITYHSAATDLPLSEIHEFGQYGHSSRTHTESGFVIHIKTSTSENASPACPVFPTSPEKWIAIIEKAKETCKLSKLLSLPSVRNASAVVIYGSDETVEQELQGARRSKIDDIVHVYVSQQFGEQVASLVDNGTRVHMQISLGHQQTAYYNTINKTSMLFLSISFIVLMIISLAWLVFYYVQRSRYTYAKQRLSKRLMCAAKKAISKMPLRTVRSGDDEMDAAFDLCAICIEGYRSSEVVRILPCKHVFHKSCIDPWLIEHRSCPICKIDILKAYGLQVHRSRESVINVEPDVVSTSFGYSEFISPDGGINGRDFDSDGVEIVRFQLAHIEYHNTPSSTAAEVLLDPDYAEHDVEVAAAGNAAGQRVAASVEISRHDDVDESTDDIQCERRMSSEADVVEPSVKKIAAQTSSIDSSKSDESEPNETQSLMTDKLTDC